MMIVIDSDFENGSLDRAVKLGENWYNLLLRPDTWYFFHCRISGCKGKTITFEITCVDISFRAPGHAHGKRRWDFGNGEYNIPVVSYDKKNWQEVDFIEKDKTLAGNTYRFRHTFIEDEAYLCYNQPYTFTDLRKFLQTVEESSLVNIGSLGKTHCGNDQPFLTITRNKKCKNLVVLIFREDADELNASFIAEGLINYLTTCRIDKVNRILERCAFQFVPMVSVEGVIAGAPYSANYGVITHKWDRRPSPPELENIKQKLKDWQKKGCKVILTGKFHGDGSNILRKSLALRGELKVTDPELGESLAASLAKYWNPMIDVSLPPQAGEAYRGGSFERFILDQFGFTPCFVTHAIGPGPDGTRKCGEYIAEAIIDYLEKKIGNPA